MVGDTIVVTKCGSRTLFPHSHYVRIKTMVGLRGTIIAEGCIDSHEYTCVKFDENIDGHDCAIGGNPCEYGFGWNLWADLGDEYEIVQQDCRCISINTNELFDLIFEEDN